ncbi:MAG: hypothetical protein ACFFCS_03420 [Candidatus Hodarchaeota archaeon]
MIEHDDHGIMLVYYNKAMDLHSISINASEDIVAFGEEKRVEIINFEHDIISKLDSDIKKYSNIDFSRVFLDAYPISNFIYPKEFAPTGKITFFPLKIKSDEFIFNYYATGTKQLDHRKILPSLEHVQEMLEEIEKITLVRGINFVQQEKILQFHSFRVLQYMEMDALDDKWVKEELIDADDIDDELKTDDAFWEIKPDYLKIGALNIPWTLDMNSKTIKLDKNGFSQEMEELKEIEEEDMMDFFEIITPLPMIPQVMETVIDKINMIWRVFSSNLSSEWRINLIALFFKQVFNLIETQELDYKHLTKDIVNVLTTWKNYVVKKYEDWFGDLKNTLESLDKQEIKEEVIKEHFNGFKEIFGDSNYNEFIEIIDQSYHWILSNPLTTAFTKNSQIAERIIEQLDDTIQKAKNESETNLIKHLKAEVIRECITTISNKIREDLLDKEEGVVRKIGDILLEQFLEEFLNDELREDFSSELITEDVFFNIQEFKIKFLIKLGDIITSFKLSIDQLIQFAGDLLEPGEKEMIERHIQRFLILKHDVEYLREFLLRDELFNEFIKNHKNHFYDPKSFANQYNDYVEEKLKEAPVEWDILVENWFTAFSNVFQLKHAQDAFSRPEIIAKFFEFIRIVTGEQVHFDNIFAIISSYVSTLGESSEKEALFQYMKRFEQSQDVQETFPSYLEKKIRALVEDIDFESELTIDLKAQSIVDGIISKRIDTSVNVFPDCLIIPSEIVFNHESNKSIEFKLECNLNENGLDVGVFSNWFKIMDVI